MTPAVHRLGALDAAFVALDADGAPFHVGGILIFERAALATAAGALDVDRLRRYLAAQLDRLPEYRRRIGRTPLLGHPVWLDTDLDLAYHVRETRVPPPGSAGELDAVVGRYFSEGLRADRPPWQLLVVDGLAGDAFAVITKVHHSLVDGFSGVKLLEHLLRGVPDATIPPRAPHEDAHPSRLALLGAELTHRAHGLRALPSSLPGTPRTLLPALGRLLARGLRRSPDLGLNPRRVGADRVIARLELDLEEVKAVKRRLGVTVNDLVLAVATGAMRRFLARRGVDVDAVHDFRAMAPASTHPAGDRALSGSRVALLLVPLPLDEPDPRRRVARIHEATRKGKTAAHEAEASELLIRISDVTLPGIVPGVLRLALAQRGFHMIVTNVPGPPFPLYLLGARLRGFHALVNLWPRQALGMALMSYDGKLAWSLHADRSVIPDLAGLVTDLEASFAELRG